VNRVTGRPEKKRCAVVCPDEGTVRAALKAEEMGLVDLSFSLTNRAVKCSKDCLFFKSARMRI